MRQVPEFEHMLVGEGVDLVKFWFSISKEVPDSKLSPLDERAQELWDDYTRYKEMMFGRTHNSFSPSIIVQANNKRSARLESIRYLLSQFEYNGKAVASTTIVPDPSVVSRFHRGSGRID